MSPDEIDVPPCHMGVTPVQHDLSAALREACDLAATNFPAATAWLQPRLATETIHSVLDCVRQLLSQSDIGTVYCTIYLVAQSHSADWAADAGWHALELGCDDDSVIIALADVLRLQTSPRQNPVSLMQERAREHRSTAFFIKLADHYVVSGQAYLAEDMLRDLVGRGRMDLMIRWAELWFELREWRSARSLLKQLPGDQMTAYTAYLTARCAVSLLLEDEVIQGAEALLSMPDPAPRFAALLRSIWAWRVGDPLVAVKACPSGDFPPLALNDANALRCAKVVAVPTGFRLKAGTWRNFNSREDLPNVLGIGMQRTATTWLRRELSKNPDVHARTIKELVFFSDSFTSMSRQSSKLRSSGLGEAGDLYWQGPTRSLLYYCDMFRNSAPCRIDISPTYAELPGEAVARVREILGPDVRIILSVRDPVERSWSNLKHDLELAGKNPFELTFRDRMSFYRSTAVLRRSDYATVVRTWRGFFEHLMIIFFDDIITRPADVLAKVKRFIALGISTDSNDYAPANTSSDTDMPRDDRMFLFGLHQQTYQAVEAELGGPALGWRQRQLDLLS